MILPAWIVVVVLTREFLVQSLRAMSEAQGKSFAADLFAKWKMIFQAVWVQALAAYLCGWDVMLPVAIVLVIPSKRNPAFVLDVAVLFEIVPAVKDWIRKPTFPLPVAVFPSTRLPVMLAIEKPSFVAPVTMLPLKVPPFMAVTENPFVGVPVIV